MRMAHTSFTKRKLEEKQTLITHTLESTTCLGIRDCIIIILQYVNPWDILSSFSRDDMTKAIWM